MRLRILEYGHPRRIKLALAAMRIIARAEPDDVIKTSLYRPKFFGRSWLKLLRMVMRGQSSWTPGQRELFGAFTSRLNACPYCVGIHTQTATLGLGTEASVERLEKWRDAGFEPRVAAMLALIDRLASKPIAVTQTDIAAARNAGLSTDAIVDALHVCFIFDLVNRLANAFGYDVLDEPDRRKTAAIIHRIGYRLPAFLLR
jgi:uncharacterized peroxidase-related enzyme